MKIKITGLLLLLFVSTVFAVHKDDKKKGEEGAIVVVPAEGVVYSLPRTGIRIQVEASRKSFFHGPYFRFAETLLGIKGAPSSDYTKWSITDIKLTTFAEPDPAQVHKAMDISGSLISLTPDGLISGINVEGEPVDESLTVSSFITQNNAPEFPFPDLSMKSFYERGDSTQSNLLLPKSFEQKAVDAAHAITKLRKRRFKTLANAYEEQHPDGMAYKIMVDELAKLEEEYVGLFIGKSYKTTQVFSFDFIPGEKSVSGEVVFRFSETNGVLPKADLSGRPVVIDMKKVETLSSAQQNIKSSDNPSAGESGVFYRIPGKADIKIMQGLSLIATSRATIAQFGEVAPVPENLLNTAYEIKYHPGTGSIKSIMEK